MIRPGVFHSSDSSKDRRVTAQTYVGQFRRTGVRIQLKSGPHGSHSGVDLTLEEFDQLVTDYLRTIFPQMHNGV